MYVNTTPLPEIETVKIFDEAVDQSKLANLSYNDNNITINFLGLWYQNPTGLLFSYRLENYDRDWIQTTDNSVTYSRLPAGDYTFRVKVSETEFFDRAKEATISFSIHPPFWQTNSFYFGIIALVLLTGYSFIKYRERALRRDNELLEVSVKQRTLEIQKQKDEIATQNQAISLQAEEIQRINENLENIVQQRTAELKRKNKVLEDYAFLNAHKLRSPVATILGLINLFEKTKLDSEGTEIHNYLKATANDLDQVVCSISRTIEKGDKLIPDELNATKEEDQV
jgi:signal transduction histidine kinase